MKIVPAAKIVAAAKIMAKIVPAKIVPAKIVAKILTEIVRSEDYGNHTSSLLLELYACTF